MSMESTMNVQGIEISFRKINENDFISLTDIAKFRTGEERKGYCKLDADL